MERNSKGQFVKGNGFKDLTGKRFGRLIVLGKSKRKVGRKSYWNCKCDCGTVKEIRSDSLTRSTIPVTSCGCLQKEKAAENVIKNHTHKESRTHLYETWLRIKTRCSNPNVTRFSDYGGRGIKVCDEWLEYESFRDWARINGYEEGLSIERIDVNGNYEPSNCTWIPFSEQANNRRTTVWVEYQGEKMNLKQLSEKTGINYGTLSSRYHREGFETIEKLIRPLDFIVKKRTYLTKKQAKEIKKLLSEGKTLGEIADMYKVSKSTVCEIKKGRKWKNA